MVSQPSEELAAKIPGASFIPLESRNHILLATERAWDIFAQVCRDFLNQPDPAMEMSMPMSAA
jgi:hypothetical protein